MKTPDCRRSSLLPSVGSILRATAPVRSSGASPGNCRMTLTSNPRRSARGLLRLSFPANGRSGARAGNRRETSSHLFGHCPRQSEAASTPPLEDGLAFATPRAILPVAATLDLLIPVYFEALIGLLRDSSETPAARPLAERMFRPRCDRYRRRRCSLAI